MEFVDWMTVQLLISHSYHLVSLTKSSASWNWKMIVTYISQNGLITENRQVFHRIRSSGRYLFIFAQSQTVIEMTLGNPIIANSIDKNYYTSPHVIACKMCKVEKKYPSIRNIAPHLFVWDTELPENAFWWSTMAVCQHYYLH